MARRDSDASWWCLGSTDGGTRAIHESSAHEDATLLDKAARDEGTFAAVKKVANDC